MSMFTDHLMCLQGSVHTAQVRPGHSRAKSDCQSVLFSRPCNNPLISTFTECVFTMRRSHLASLLKEHCLVEGGDSNVKQWLKDEGIESSVAGALKVCSYTEICCHALSQKMLI